MECIYQNKQTQTNTTQHITTSKHSIMESSTICLTFGEQSENHVGMKINGGG
jgi:hypothetical protein